jgi:ribosome biogenesis protein Nip4
MSRRDQRDQGKGRPRKTAKTAGSRSTGNRPEGSRPERKPAERETGREGSRSDGEEPEKERHWIEFASKELKDLVHAELSSYGDSDAVWQALVVKGDNNVFTYTKGAFYSVHLLPRAGKDRFKFLMGNPGLIHFGLFLGMLKKDQFNLSLEGADMLVKSGAMTRNWIILNEEGEKAFLYGQDVKKEHLGRLARGGISHDRGICIVMNELNECLGVGKLVALDPFLKKIDDEEVLVKNVVDKGIFLRNQEKDNV